MSFKIIGSCGNVPFEISADRIDWYIKNHGCSNDIQLTECLFDESYQICGLKGLADLGHGYGFNYGWKEFEIRFDEIFSFEHSYTSIEGSSDWFTESYKVTLKLIKTE